MSASFPSSTGWEPYGSSQQAHALGWRRPATRPPPPLPFDRPPTTQTPPPFSTSAAARWNQQTAIRPAKPKENLPTNPHRDTSAPSPALAASFHHHERDTRVLARYEAVRADIRSVDTQLNRLTQTLKQDAGHLAGRYEDLSQELARLQGVFESVREDIREVKAERDHLADKFLPEMERRLVNEIRRREKNNGQAQEQKLRRTTAKQIKDVENVVQGVIRDAEERIQSVVVSKVQQVVTDEIANAVRKAFEQNNPPTQRAWQDPCKSIPLVLPLGKDARHIRHPRRCSPPVPDASDSAELYAMQVANRARPPSAHDSSNFDEAFHQLEHVNSLRDNEPHLNAIGSCPLSAGGSLFGEDTQQALPHSESTEGSPSNDPSFLRPHSPSESDSLQLGLNIRRSRNIRRACTDRYPGSGRSVRKQGGTRNIATVRNNVRANTRKASGAIKAPFTRSRASQGVRRR